MLTDESSLALLRRAELFVTSPKSPAEVQYEISERWVQLLACMFLANDVNVTSLSVNQRVMALVKLNPSIFDNETLRVSYPTIMKKPKYVLLEFLTNNPMAQQLYCALFDGNTYEVLRLKLMGTLVAILQDFYSVGNVDDYLSVFDVAYIMHVGGVMLPTHSGGVMFRSDIVEEKLPTLLRQNLHPMLAQVPRQFDKLTSEQRWLHYFKEKLRTPAIITQLAQQRFADIQVIMTMLSSYTNSRPQFVKITSQADALQIPAESSDYVRILAIQIKRAFDRH